MGRRDRQRSKSRASVRGHQAGKPPSLGERDDASESRARLRRFLPLALLGLLVTLAAFLAHAWHFRHYVNDDAFITFRYSRFLLMGRGPYFNVGERVEGYSNPLLMLLMVPVIAWGGEHAALPGAKIIGAACGGLSLVAAFVLCLVLQRDEGRSWPAWISGCLAAGLIAVSPSYAINSMNGLETTLFGLSITAGVLLGTLAAQQGAWRGAGAAFACGVLSRPEGALLFAVFWCAQAISAFTTRSLRSIRSILVFDAVIVTGVFVAQLVFRRLAYDGEWLPNTYFAKSGGFWAFAAWEYVRDGIMVPLGGSIAVAIGVVGWFLSSASRRWIAPAAAVALTGGLLPFITGTDWMPGQRLVMPYLPLAAALIAIGWSRVARALVARPAWLAPSTAFLLVPWLWVSQTPSRTELFEDSWVRARGYQAGHTALAEWLRSAARPGDTVALMDTGIIGFLCIDQQILDITGLTNRFIARSPGEFLDKQYDPAYVFDQKPRFIVLVIKQQGNPDEQPTGAGFSTWTNIEAELLHYPDFNRWYRKPRAVGAPDEPWLDKTAKGLGAVRMFQHAHPGVFYLLTVFERQDRPAL